MVDEVLLYCYHYDPDTGKYGAVITRILQLVGHRDHLLPRGAFRDLDSALGPRRTGKERNGSR